LPVARQSQGPGEVGRLPQRRFRPRHAQGLAAARVELRLRQLNGRPLAGLPCGSLGVLRCGRDSRWTRESSNASGGEKQWPAAMSAAGLPGPTWRRKPGDEDSVDVIDRVVDVELAGGRDQPRITDNL